MRTFLLSFFLSALVITPGCSSSSSDPLASECKKYSKYSKGDLMSDGEAWIAGSKKSVESLSAEINDGTSTEKTKRGYEGFNLLDKAFVGFATLEALKTASTLDPPDGPLSELITESNESFRDKQIQLFLRQVTTATALIETTCFPEQFTDLYSSPEQVLEKLNNMGIGDWKQEKNPNDVLVEPEYLHSYSFYLIKNEKYVCSADLFLNEDVAESNLGNGAVPTSMIRNKNVVIRDSLKFSQDLGLEPFIPASIHEPGSCLVNW